MKEPLFRSEAVAAIDSVDRLDEAITIVSARSTLALAAILVMLAIAVVWAIFGTIPMTIEGRGVILAGSGIAQVIVTQDGTIATVEVAVGDTVVAGEAIARERTSSGKIVALRASRPGSVVEITRAAGVFVRSGDSVASVASAAGLRAVVFVPVASDRRVEEGMTASVVPVDVPGLGGRGVRAQVVGVAPYPASAERIRSALQNDALAAQFASAEPVREVQLALQENPDGTLVWTGLGSATAPVAAGTPCTATIQVQERHPIDIVFSRNQ
jgi:hypothetical protein